ncbi:MAG: OmpA family protein [Bacteroidota bacterium]
MLTIAWISFARYYYVCEIRKNCPHTKEEQLAPRAQSLELLYQDSIILSGYEEFAFAPEQVSPQLSPNNLEFLDTLATFLNEHPDLQLTISRDYRRSEMGISAGFHENLGLARADSIRNLLLVRGVQNDIALNFNALDGEQLDRPLRFTLSNREQTPDEYAKVVFTFYNMTFSDANFEFDSDVFQPGSALISYADSVSQYLVAHPEQQLTIIGHTDAVGTEAYNLDLGLRRAKSAQKYFQELGIQNPIKVDSKGKKEPMAPNDTPANKQKNRRVNFLIE